MPLSKERKREYEIERRRAKIARGECVRCSRIAAPNKQTCKACWNKIQCDKKRYRNQLQKNDKCRECGKPVDFERCRHKRSIISKTSKSGKNRYLCLDCGITHYENYSFKLPYCCLKCTERRFYKRWSMKPPHELKLHLARCKIRLLKRYLATQNPELRKHLEANEIVRSTILLRL